MTDGLFESLLHEEESSSLDFKRDQYPFVGASDDDKSELLKDILAFGNSWRRSTAYILIGVEEVKGGRSVVHGVSQHLADNDLQQFVNSKTNRTVSFSYAAFPFEGKQVGIITVPQQERPVFLNKDFGRLKKQAVYVRQSSSTAPASPDDIARMGAASATDAWAQKELEQQRREREEQRLLQLRLHGAVNRPHVLCDFPIVHTVVYLRVKNYGTQPARDIRMSVACDGGELPSVACLRYPISFLAPDSELFYWIVGPQDFNKLPKKLTFKLVYTDLQGRPFEEEEPFDFGYFGDTSGGGCGRGADLSRENNHPVVRQLRRIADALTGGDRPRHSPFGGFPTGGR
jgi:hypothetical protein